MGLGTTLTPFKGHFQTTFRVGGWDKGTWVLGVGLGNYRFGVLGAGTRGWSLAPVSRTWSTGGQPFRILPASGTLRLGALEHH